MKMSNPSGKLSQTLHMAFLDKLNFNEKDAITNIMQVAQD